MSPLEVFAAAIGIVNIVLIARRTLWNYPFGVAMVACYAVVFWQQQLYATAALQLFFLASQLYGWWYWRQSGADGPVPVRRLGRTGRLATLAAGVLGTLAVGLALARSTSDPAPWPDAANFAWSMVAQVLTDRRHVESWPLWVAIDIGSVWLYASQGLLVTAALYAVFLCIACWGWSEWSRAAPQRLAV